MGEWKPKVSSPQALSTVDRDLLDRAFAERAAGRMTDAEYQATRADILANPTPDAAPRQSLIAKKDQPWGWIGGIGAVVLLLVFLNLPDGDDGRSPRQPRPQPPAPAAVETVLYEVEGTAKSASITMNRASGTEQIDVDVPMMNQAGKRGLTMTGASAPNFKYISAQNLGESGTVTCRITVNGRVVSEVTSTGAYKIATCKA